MLRPLLEAALDGALRAETSAAERGAGAIGALTGPVRRGDAGTVRAHQVALASFAAATGAVDVVTDYRALARSAAGRALAAGLISDAAAGEVLDAIHDTFLVGIDPSAGSLDQEDTDDDEESGA
jgi:predicted short-subunit dehydrogenase-like oxidoreductase (DUF2520 family)